VAHHVGRTSITEQTDGRAMDAQPKPEPAPCARPSHRRRARHYERIPVSVLDDLTAEPLPRLTSRMLSARELRAQFESIRERDEAILGEAGVAAPIFDHSGHAVGAVGVVGDTERIVPRGPAKGLVAAVAEAAAGISRELGARS
jgi:DNA-binding IclR family transcriptional regulator